MAAVLVRRLKRDRKVLICMTDDEYAALDRLVATYSLEGARATKSFLVRYALKCLPHQQQLNFSEPGQILKSAC